MCNFTVPGAGIAMAALPYAARSLDWEEYHLHIGHVKQPEASAMDVLPSAFQLHGWHPNGLPDSPLPRVSA